MGLNSSKSEKSVSAGKNLRKSYHAENLHEAIQGIKIHTIVTPDMDNNHGWLFALFVVVIVIIIVVVVVVFFFFVKFVILFIIFIMF